MPIRKEHSITELREFVRHEVEKPGRRKLLIGTAAAAGLAAAGGLVKLWRSQDEREASEREFRRLLERYRSAGLGENADFYARLHSIKESKRIAKVNRLNDKDLLRIHKFLSTEKIPVGRYDRQHPNPDYEPIGIDAHAFHDTVSSNFISKDAADSLRRQIIDKQGDPHESPEEIQRLRRVRAVMDFILRNRDLYDKLKALERFPEYRFLLRSGRN